MNYDSNRLAQKYAESFLKGKYSVKKPKMPKNTHFAYTDNEYNQEILNLNSVYDLLDCVELTELFLKGD